MRQKIIVFALAALPYGCIWNASLAAQDAQCKQYGIIQVIGASPDKTTLQTIVIGQPGQRKTIVLPASSSANYKIGQRICIDPPPAK